MILSRDIWEELLREFDILRTWWWLDWEMKNDCRMIKNGTYRLGSSMTLEKGYLGRLLVSVAFQGALPENEESMPILFVCSGMVSKS